MDRYYLLFLHPTPKLVEVTFSPGRGAVSTASLQPIDPEGSVSIGDTRAQALESALQRTPPGTVRARLRAMLDAERRECNSFHHWIKENV